jgi:hypothetical protein
MKSLMTQIKTTVDSIFSQQEQDEERISRLEDKMEEILDSHNNKN